jgi:surfeit locus 1 family protein
LAGFFFLVFAALGTWQVYRLQWKLDLIAKVTPACTPHRWRRRRNWPHARRADEYKRAS